jgi:hypothetical protein
MEEDIDVAPIKETLSLTKDEVSYLNNVLLNSTIPCRDTLFVTNLLYKIQAILKEN